MSGWRGAVAGSGGFSLLQLLVVPVIIGGVLAAGLALRQGAGSSPISPEVRRQAERQAHEAVQSLNDQMRVTQETLKNALSRGRADGTLADDASTAERKR